MNRKVILVLLILVSILALSHVSASENVNATNATTTHTMPATVNPILALFCVCAILGGYAVIKRK